MSIFIKKTPHLQRLFKLQSTSASTFGSRNPAKTILCWEVPPKLQLTHLQKEAALHSSLCWKQASTNKGSTAVWPDVSGMCTHLMIPISSTLEPVHPCSSCSYA
eukprot:scaffold46698_cov19-Tisochrysis_lutea.AAC.1